MSLAQAEAAGHNFEGGKKPMKNLKKVLSLVLALAMAFSLMSIAFAADKATNFTDYDEIDYQEAVNVLTSIGVINGVDDGDTFNPTGTLTREQGAKIITYMLLGQDAADQLTTARAPFSDVPATKWSAGAIAYCAERGILAGTGDGTFKPEGTLTGYAFAKMLLTALDYDPTAQGYTGTGWALNVAGDAVDAGIDITGLVMSNDLTREQAAQMAYKTLKADIVAYPYANLGTTITTSDGTTVVAGNSRPESKSTSSGEGYNGKNDSVLQFVEKYFPKLKLNTSATDAFGRPGEQWTNYATNETLPIELDTPVQTYTAETKAAQIASDMSVYKLVDNLNPNTQTVNGVTTTSYNSSNITNTTARTSIQTTYLRNGTYNVNRDVINVDASTNAEATSVAAEIAKLTKDGKTVEFYADSNNNITDIVTIAYTVGEVTSVTTTNTQTNYVINGNTYRDFVDENATDTIKIQNGATLAAGDIVTFAVAPGGIAYVWPTTQVTGTQSARNTGNKQITVAGTVYPVGVGLYTNSADTTVEVTDFENSNIEGIYYIDQFGYVIKTTTVASNDYAYVVAVYGTRSSGLGGNTPSIQARVVLSDGTVVDRSVALTKTGTDWYLSGDNSVNFGASSSFTSDSAVNTAAQVLMNRAFTYNLTDSQITLKTINGINPSSVVNGTLSTNNTTNTVYTASSNAATGNYIAKNKNSYSDGNGNTLLVNNNTKFIVYSASPNTAVVYSGSVNLPSAISDTNTTGYFVTKTNENTDGSGKTNIATASVVFIYRGGEALTADVNNVYAYVTQDKVATTLDGNTTNYVYTATKADGSTVELTSTTAISADGIYTYNENTNVLNTTALANAVADSAIGTATAVQDKGRIIYDNSVTVSGSLVAIDIVGATNYYSITSDTQIVYIDENLGEVNNNGGFFVLETDSDGAPTSNIAAIFMTVD
jgi:hypothetical protein